MSANPEFINEVNKNIDNLANNTEMKQLNQKWLEKSVELKYSYNFSWMGRPIIQYPQDIVAMQEIIWNVKPDLIIETGIAHGGSVIFYASILELLGENGHVVGIDIDIRKHNREEIEKHSMFKRITLIEGSSINEKTVSLVKDKISEFNAEKILVVLDSNHTGEHVNNELELYSPFVSKDSYLVVFDTLIENMPDNFYSDRPWSVGNNPMTAVNDFLKKNDCFEIDKTVENKLGITVAPNGYLKRIK